ncbi:hypothetical protein FZEAL_9742 [Fusarium zealandicum]|uniref:C2H2-type domain-containing protein n=1 Tax=Fusarium zealandicum TaxID=1053134 RepID=A0A8H4U922_9HYPO|nr:hypothetical protein FZEAL_9742 [Fusarium zealandicum]
MCDLSLTLTDSSPGTAPAYPLRQPSLSLSQDSSQAYNIKPWPVPIRNLHTSICFILVPHTSSSLLLKYNRDNTLLGAYNCITRAFHVRVDEAIISFTHHTTDQLLFWKLGVPSSTWATSQPQETMGSSYNYNYWHGASSPQDEATSPQEYACEYYQSLPLSRYSSSGGSSQASYIPDSPSHYSLHGSSAVEYSGYLQDTAYQQDSPYQQYYSSTTATVKEPVAPRSEVYVSTIMAPPSPPLTCTRPPDSCDWPVNCLVPGCTARPFKRSADLQRHYRNTHVPESSKDTYLCDYPRCTRSREPFHRRDHFRDHLREYHREDIQKRGATVNEEWLEGRYTPTTWWRCPRCLVRVYISKNNFQCPNCKTSCEPKRKEKRRSRS